MNYILDTNIISALMEGDKRVKDKLQIIIMKGESVFINGISYYEIKRGLLATNATNKLKNFVKMCNSNLFNILLLDNINIFDKASEIYAFLKQKGRPISDADILIGASVLTKNYICVSNDKDFSEIDGLILEDWLK
ncbi:MAG TPA: PIN domain-containing protein [Dictyoglomaceae bacterium]|nr:PIN domain-containing protein [Dictyoglomaceae bacterium]HOL40123.1 PIN domain-containing protein [Dictyoglomaceae bacterium]HPP16661.1 PIN domain-containing protein [Dictyoglomaceae bacterium]